MTKHVRWLGRSQRPTTRSALFLLGRLRGDDTLKGDRTGDSRAEFAVWQAAFELAVKKRFPAGNDHAQVANFVLNLRTYSNKAFAYVPAIDTEALIRVVLGEDIDVSDLTFRDRGNIYFATLFIVVKEMKLTDKQINRLLAQAEQLAIERGFQPR
jgi:hypothetical protein